jgi:hypothetical protein
MDIPGKFSMEPGTVLYPSNGGAEPIEMTISEIDGVTLRFNLLPGQRAEIRSGGAELTIESKSGPADDLLRLNH